MTRHNSTATARHTNIPLAALMRPIGFAEQSRPTRIVADVAIVGGGPVGCVAALALAQTGARVCLIDAGTPSGRLAGEWLHPTGAGILADLGVDLQKLHVPHAVGQGFAIFPKGSDPIVLPYDRGETGIGCQHHLLVEALQQHVAANDAIHAVVGYRVSEVSIGRVRAVSPDRTNSIQVDAGLIVGADGRQSIVRQALGYSSACTPVSYMAGVLIDAAALPYPAYGNVFIGGPGPTLAFRVNANQVRVCFDVPGDRVQWIRNPLELLAAYRPALPLALFEACEAAFQKSPPAVAANQWLRRRRYGRAGIALIGDAVGHCHPLCAVGMSVGFLDAIALAKSRSVQEFELTRMRSGRVPELLSMGLYKLFVGSEPSSHELRDAVYHLWRTSPATRRDTMRLLAVRETRQSSLSVTLARLLTVASRDVLAGALRQPLTRTLACVAGLSRWAGWYTREALFR